jgi:hypothetical protein
MTAASYVRLINNQIIKGRSILIDKIDRSQGNFTGYANRAKQPIYVPYTNPVDPNVAGYINLVPTDEVLLSEEAKGTITGLTTASTHYPTPPLTKSLVTAASILAPVITEVASGVTLTITGPAGATFVSVTPDVTYLILTNLANVTKTYKAPAITVVGATSITIPDASITGGPIATGWKVQVLANSKYSNVYLVP